MKIDNYKVGEYHFPSCLKWDGDNCDCGLDVVLEGLANQVAIAEKLNRGVDVQEALHRYSNFLEKNGYMDSDWWSEPPNAVDRFLDHERSLSK